MSHEQSKIEDPKELTALENEVWEALKVLNDTPLHVLSRVHKGLEQAIIQVKERFMDENIYKRYHLMERTLDLLIKYKSSEV